MTVLGKILVFVNLVFSVVVGALIIMVFINRTQWAVEFGKLDKNYKAAGASAQSYANETDAVRKEMAERVSAIDKDLKIAQAERDKANLELDLAKKAEATAVAQQKVFEANLTANNIELQRRQSEAKYLESQIAKLQDDNNKLVVSTNKMRDLKTAAEIERDSVRGRNQNLIQKIEELAKDNTKLKAPATTAATTISLTKNPPPEYVEGLIKEIDAASGLMSITLGSDHGLKTGHTMEAFRLSPAKYLGTVYVVEVRATTAVVRPMGKLNGQLQAGDKVASKIVGG